MIGLARLLFLAAALAASACAAANPAGAHAPAGVASPSWRIAPHHHAHAQAAHSPRVAPRGAIRHSPARHAVVILPVALPAVTPYVVVTPPAYPSAPAAAATESYEVAARPAHSGAGYARPQGWNWTPVESIVPLAGRGEVRHYCPDLREYYPAVETCPSPWLKVVP